MPQKEKPFKKVAYPKGNPALGAAIFLAVWLGLLPVLLALLVVLGVVLVGSVFLFFKFAVWVWTA